MVKLITLFYLLMAFGVVTLGIGTYMFIGMHLHGTAYLVLLTGFAALVGAITGMVITTPKPSTTIP